MKKHRHQTSDVLARQRLIRLIFMIVCSIILLASCGSNSTITMQESPGNNLKAGEMVQMSFVLNREVNNPYNSNEIEISLNVWQENDDTLKVPAFHYTGNTDPGQTGEPVWKVRFTPLKAGNYHYNLSVKHELEITETATETFRVTENNYDGFIRARQSERVFRHASGKVFFPSGLNLAHPPHTGAPLNYDYFFQKMKENNMNFMRIWLTPQWGENAIALEWTDNQYPSQKGNLGLRKINSAMASRLDSIMNSALNHGIFVMLCLLDERELEPQSHWKENPYNAEVGGVISDPMEFFSDQQAKSAFKNRLRYLIARYSAYPNLFAWEFWNEFDHHRLIPDWETMRKDVGQWHHEMSRYLKQNDPHKHMVSTSVVGSRTDKIIWDFEEIDFVQAHSYVGKDHLADRSHELYVLFKNEYPHKPFFIGEMGTDWHGFTRENNAEAVGLHHGLWETSLGGHSATGMWWWWNELDNADLWNEWKNISTFTKNINRTNSQYHFVNPDDESQLAGRYVVSGDSIWLWFYNREYNWKNIKEGNQISNTKPAQFKLQDIPAGNYNILRFEEGQFNEAGKLISEGSATIEIPAFRTDFAAMLIPEK